MKTLTRLLLIALAAAGVSVQAQAQARRGSIYDASRGPFGLVANKTANRPGDLITIVISEIQSVKNEERSNIKTESELDYQLNSFNIKPSAFNVLPDLTSASTDDFRGTANYEKRGRFTARLTAVVVDALPNGNLVVSGRREIRIDKEIKVIEVSGIVRRYDIAADNSIESEMVANAKVSYTGSGPMTRATNRHGLGGWLRAAFAWIWPF